MESFRKEKLQPLTHLKFEEEVSKRRLAVTAKIMPDVTIVGKLARKKARRLKKTLLSS